MAMKVHVIEADLTGTLPNSLSEREKLGQEIVGLALKSHATVWFHEFKSDMLGGAPTIMLECSDKFMDEVRKLPSYRKDQPAFTTPGLETERSAKLQHYFFTGGAARKTRSSKMNPPGA
jgi:hypothetical protein